MITLNETVEQKKKIAEKGNQEEFNKKIAYYYRLYRKNLISQEEYLQASDDTLAMLGGL